MQDCRHYMIGLIVGDCNFKVVVAFCYDQNSFHFNMGVDLNASECHSLENSVVRHVHAILFQKFVHVDISNGYDVDLCFP